MADFRIQMVCPCHFGLESVLKFEITKIGGENISVSDGKVSFEGDFSVLARANICLASAERVLIKLGEFRAVSFEDLFEGVKALPFSDFIGAGDKFPVKGYSLNSALKSVPDCQSIIKKAAVESLKLKYNTSWFEETGALYQIQFSIMNDIAAIYIDSTGEPLHKRGYRKSSVTAPIKETLAAGIIDLARIRENSIVIDPFCGSGTFLIEAAYKAMNIAPGLNRQFAAESFGIIDGKIWEETREQARAAIKKDADFQAFGFDIDEKAIALSRENCRRAGILSKVKLQTAPIEEFNVPGNNSITVANPPYGERMLDIAQMPQLYKKLGERFSHIENFKETPCYIIAPHEQFEDFFGKKARKKRKLYNGMIKCQLYMYF